MNIKFYPEESKLYDFLSFPRLIYYMESYEESKNNHNYEDLDMEEYLNFVKKVEDRLKPFIKEIEEFYTKPFISDYNFIDLNTKSDSIFGYKDEKEFLNFLLELTDKDINKNIIYSLIKIDEGHNSNSEDVMKMAEEICVDKNEILSFIKNLNIDSGLKWNLFLTVEEPTRYMRKYVDLMLKVLPIFNEFYNPLLAKVNAYGVFLEDTINKNGAKAIEELTNSIIDAKIIDAEKVSLLVTVSLSYSIVLMPIKKESIIAWGIKMEDAFRQMKEINENKTNERVQIFKNLGDKTRYEVLKLIASGETSIKVIAETLGVSSATISYHINNFLTSKVIKMDKIDNKYGYIVDYHLLEETLEAFKEDLKFPQKTPKH